VLGQTFPLCFQTTPGCGQGDRRFKSPCSVAVGCLPYSGRVEKAGEQRKMGHKDTGVTACIVCKPMCDNIKVFLYT